MPRGRRSARPAVTRPPSRDSSGIARGPRHHARRASVVGAGSFGTAVALLLERAGVRTTLLCRTEEQAAALEESRRNEKYLPGIDLPGGLQIRTLGNRDDQFHRRSEERRVGKEW